MRSMDEIADASAWRSLSPEAVQLAVSELKKRNRMPDAACVDAFALSDALCVSYGESLTLSGAMLLCRRPDRFIEGSYVRIGKFDSDGNAISEETIREPLLLQPRKTVKTLFENYLGSRLVYGNMFLDASYDYPAKAVEEAVLNACVHRDFFSNDPVEVRVHPDRLEIVNSGGLPEGWDVKRLEGEHRSKPRNVRIADAFHELGLMGCWGKGIGLMGSECSKAGTPPPEFVASRDGFSVIFHTVAAAPEIVEPPEEEIIETVPESSIPDRILEIIAKGDLRTGQEISEAVGINRRQFTRIMAELMESGAVVREGNRRKGKWTVRRRSLRVLDRLQKPVERGLGRHQVGAPAQRLQPLRGAGVHGGDLHVVVQIRPGGLDAVLGIHESEEGVRGGRRRECEPVELPPLHRYHHMEHGAADSGGDGLVKRRLRIGIAFGPGLQCALRILSCGRDPEMPQTFRGGACGERPFALEHCLEGILEMVGALLDGRGGHERDRPSGGDGVGDLRELPVVPFDYRDCRGCHHREAHGLRLLDGIDEPPGRPHETQPGHAPA